MKIILAFDSFKGSASSAELAAAAAEGIALAAPGCRTVSFVLADGGEGTTEALSEALGAHAVACEVCDPLGRLTQAVYAIAGETAIIETAAASGLTLIAPSQRNPMNTSSYGTGQLIADALGRGCREFILGLGGSATNDAATGILAALGYRFLDSTGAQLEPKGANLAKIAAIDDVHVHPVLAEAHFTLACDVDNPFCGSNGAARVYGPQKGASPADVAALDEGMEHYAELIQMIEGIDIRNIPGAGAAGGISGGLLPFLNARIRPGIDTVLDALGFDAALEGASLVLAGEGRLDAQSAMGKVVGGIVRRARICGVPVVALAGEVADSHPLEDMGLAAAFSVHTGPVTFRQAMRKDITLRGMKQTAGQVARMLGQFASGK